MQIAFRADASRQIGTGHVMRCLTLADALRERGAQCSFLCRPHVGHLLDTIRNRGHQAISLEPADGSLGSNLELLHEKWLGTDWMSDVEQTRRALDGRVLDWLVVDHYALDFRWEKAMRPQSRRVCVIDDLADRAHDSDLLLDQSLGREVANYRGLIGQNSQTRLGPVYALVRPEFAQWRGRSLIRRTQPRLSKLLVTMGGVDQSNVTSRVLDAINICDLPADLVITIVMGRQAPWQGHVRAKAARMIRRTEVLYDVNNMAELMAETDLCIGAAGSTVWELCCLGVPTLLVCIATNQGFVTSALNSVGAAVTVSLDDLIMQKGDLFQKQYKLITENLAAYSTAAARVTDGFGAMRVSDEMASWMEKY